MYQGQVDRLRKEIADLEGKAADQRARANRERGEALRATNSINGSSSPGSVRSKLGAAQRREASAVAHDKRAASYADDIARKGRQLSGALASLDRAHEQQRKKEDAEQRQRREAELRHIAQLEANRRAMQTPQAIHLPLLTSSSDAAARAEPGYQREVAGFEFDICLSFASEERAYVEMVSAGLKAAGLRVFYDEDEKVSLWGKNLVEHFDHVYRTASRYCVMFVSEAYAAKTWTRQERRSALARALVEEGEYILPARFDKTDLPGLLPTVAYLDLSETAPATLVEFVLEKVGTNVHG